MSVTFMNHGPNIASSRYRAAMPQTELATMGHPLGRGVLVASKHGWSWEEKTRGFKKVVYDVCTNHFDSDNPHSDFYRMACSQADAVVSASHEMARIVKRETGRDSWVIEDPYEERECDPKVSDRLLWHGHVRNAREIEAWRSELAGRNLMLVTGGGRILPPGYTQWSLETLDRAYDACGMVVLPYLGNPESTANRAINAIRRGRWPVCGPLPALAEFGVWQGHIAEGVDWALANQAEVLNRLYVMQDYVGTKFSPRAIAAKWQHMLESI